MSSTAENRSYVDDAVEAFRGQLARMLDTRDRVPGGDPRQLGAAAARFAVAHAHGSGPVVARIGPVYGTDDLGRWLTGPGEKELTTEAVRKRAKHRHLVAFRTDDGQWAFPAWQFDAVAGRLAPRDAVIALWRSLPHASFLDAADLAVWMNTRLQSLRDTPARRAQTHGVDDDALRDTVARLTARARGSAA